MADLFCGNHCDAAETAWSEFVITTHSVDFLTALEYFTKKYAIEKKCSYYIMELNENGSAYAKETSGHLDEAYARLSNPFIQLTDDLEEQS